SLDGMLCKHHFSKNGQVFFHIFWVVTLIMQSRYAIPTAERTPVMMAGNEAGKMTRRKICQ
ncbi:hypothetical protein EFP52_09350, partial [Lacticaseibacillus paracasei]|nr:hypothetical protein [Lacticaseibacillus paracasei]